MAIRGVGATDKDTAYRGRKRGRQMSAYELQQVAQLPRSPGRQLLTNDVATGYQYQRAMEQLTRDWLEKNG